MTVVGEAASGAHGLRLVEQLQLNIVTLESHLADMDGFSLTRNICRCYPRIAVVFFCLYDDSAYIQQAYASGAVGYVSKTAPLAELRQTILQVWQLSHSPTSQSDPTSSGFIA